MIRVFSKRAIAKCASLAMALCIGLAPGSARAALVADPQVLYNEMKAAYDKAGSNGWDFRDQELYLSTIFNAGRAYSLQRPNDAAYGEIAALAVQVGSALHYDPLINHDATTWYVREAAQWVIKNSTDPAQVQNAQTLLDRVNSEDSVHLAQLADQDATANVAAYPHNIDSSLQQVEADWRGWVLTHDPSWRSLALQRAAQVDFPLAHLPTTWGPEFLQAADTAASDGDGFTAGDRENGKTIAQRVKKLPELLVIASVTAVPHDKYLSTLAPADEYFGRMGYSILGIENQLKHINFMLNYNYGNREAPDALLVAEAIDDMHKVYPRDRDMPMLLYSCITTLDRMTSPDVQGASAHLRWILTVEYQDSAEARKVLNSPRPT